jgi:hypothetical protein
MKVTPRMFLAITFAVALPVTFWPRPPDYEQMSVATNVENRQASSDMQQRRWVAKELIAQEVADGRRSLFEAAALYEALNRLPPATSQLIREDGGDLPLHAFARTNEELLCRQVSRWVQRRLRDTPEQARKVLARLAAEFADAQARPGGLRLPDSTRVEPIKELLGRVRSAAAQPDHASAIETLTGTVPETVALRGWAKDQIAREVAAGRRGLLDAAALYGELNQLPPVVNHSKEDVDNWPWRDPVRTDEERLCRQVMTWVQQLLSRESPDRVGQVSDRLEAEFRAGLREQGEIRLPGPSLPALRDVLVQARAGMMEARRPSPSRSGQKR